jgi:hypothetical protein
LNREPIDGPETIEDCRMIKEAINVDLSVNESFNWRTLFSNGPSQHFRRCLLGAGICLMQQIGVRTRTTKVNQILNSSLLSEKT